jgi:hypothetical protein
MNRLTLKVQADATAARRPFANERSSAVRLRRSSPASSVTRRLGAASAGRSSAPASRSATVISYRRYCAIASRCSRLSCRHLLPSPPTSGNSVIALNSNLTEGRYVESRLTAGGYPHTSSRFPGYILASQEWPRARRARCVRQIPEAQNAHEPISLFQRHCRHFHRRIPV